MTLGRDIHVGQRGIFDYSCPICLSSNSLKNTVQQLRSVFERHGKHISWNSFLQEGNSVDTPAVQTYVKVIQEKRQWHISLHDRLSHCLSVNLLDKSKGCKLENVCDLFYFSSVIKRPSCFTSGNKPSPVDVILTNSTFYIGKIFNFGCGLSDVHNLIGAQLKLDVPFSKIKR